MGTATCPHFFPIFYHNMHWKSCTYGIKPQTGACMARAIFEPSSSCSKISLSRCIFGIRGMSCRSRSYLVRIPFTSPLGQPFNRKYCSCQPQKVFAHTCWTNIFIYFQISGEHAFLNLAVILADDLKKFMQRNQIWSKTNCFLQCKTYNFVSISEHIVRNHMFSALRSQWRKLCRHDKAWLLESCR